MKNQRENEVYLVPGVTDRQKGRVRQFLRKKGQEISKAMALGVKDGRTKSGLYVGSGSR